MIGLDQIAGVIVAVIGFVIIAIVGAVGVTAIFAAMGSGK